MRNISCFAKLDIYRILKLFEITDPCLQHAVKKLLCAGKRKHKSTKQDLEEVIDAIHRYLEMEKEEIIYMDALSKYPKKNV